MCCNSDNLLNLQSRLLKEGHLNGLDDTMNPGFNILSGVVAMTLPADLGKNIISKVVSVVITGIVVIISIIMRK